MKNARLLSVVALLCSLALAAPSAAKRAPREEDEPERSSSSSSASSYNLGGGTSSTPWGKTFGVGLQLGAPTALTGKLRLEYNSALIFSLGGGWSWWRNFGFELSVGYVIHPSTLASYEPLDLNWYVGGALDVAFYGSRYVRPGSPVFYYGYYSPVGIGGHIPVGLDFQLRAIPLSIYLELTPGIEIFPFIGPRLGGALGARFFF